MQNQTRPLESGKSKSDILARQDKGKKESATPERRQIVGKRDQDAPTVNRLQKASYDTPREFKK